MQQKGGGFKFSLAPFVFPLADHTAILTGSVSPELGQKYWLLPEVMISP